VINHFFSGPFQQILKQKNKSYSKGRSDLQTTHVTLYLAKLFLSSGERGLLPRRVPPVLGNRLGSLFHIPHAQENIYPATGSDPPQSLQINRATVLNHHQHAFDRNINEILIHAREYLRQAIHLGLQPAGIVFG
jgi:hypothetical protein